MRLLLESIGVAIFTGVLAFMVFTVGAATIVIIGQIGGKYGISWFVIFAIAIAVGITYYKDHS